MKTSLRQLILAGVLLELMIFVLSYFSSENLNETIRLSARFSGRLSAVLFLMVFFLYASLKGGKVERETPFFNNLIFIAEMKLLPNPTSRLGEKRCIILPFSPRMFIMYMHTTYKVNMI